jgi:hypothetical protein
MSSRTILDNDFEFNNLHLNHLQFSDNSIQTTAYLGNSPLPSQVVYNLPINTQLITNNGYSTILENVKIINLHTGFMSGLYFQDSSGNNINSLNINFSNSFTGNLQITLIDVINSLPYYTSSFAISIINDTTKTLTFGNIIINKTGSLITIFDDININNTNTYTLNVLTYVYA